MSHPFDEAELHHLAAALAQSDDAVSDAIEQIRTQHSQRQFANLIAIGFSVTKGANGKCRIESETFLCLRSEHDATHSLEALQKVERRILEKLARSVIQSIFGNVTDPPATPE